MSTLTSTQVHEPSMMLSQPQHVLNLQSHIGCQSEQADIHTRFWWESTGVPFAALLEGAGYPSQLKDQILLFYLRHIIPHLGPGQVSGNPTQSWRSFMTDHHCPVEMSWEWGAGTQDPVVRFSVEPIGTFAGSPVDPFNQYAAAHMISQCQSMMPTCDLQLFQHFNSTLVSYNQKSTGDDEHQSRMFLAFDLCKDDVMLKAYFMPSFKAADQGISSMSLICDAVKQFPVLYSSVCLSLNNLTSFCASVPELKLKAEIFAIDCVSPEVARLKIYMRSRSTSLQSVKTIMTLNGKLTDVKTLQGLEELDLVWRLVLGLRPDYPRDKELPLADHRTAGILYYFELKAGKSQPSPKVYIPVRHYGRNDMTIATGLQAYLTSVGKGALAPQYIETLRHFE